MTSSSSRYGFRLAALLLAIGVIAVGCRHDGVTEDAAEPADPDAEETQFENYRVGIFEDTTTTNFWAYMDPDSTVWNGYVLAPTKPSLFSITYPIREGLPAGGVVVPDLAEGEPVEPQQEGDGWVVEQRIKEGLEWSDGTPITANDFVFTVETVHEFELSGNWLAAYPRPTEDSVGIESVEAVDDHTVRIVFNREPGLAIWPHEVGTGPWMPQHVWNEIVEGARGAEDPAAELYGAAGDDDVSGGPVSFEAREEGAFARNVANEQWHGRGIETRLTEEGTVQRGDEEYGGATDPDATTDDDAADDEATEDDPATEDEDEAGNGENGEATVAYTEGPFFQTQTFTLYGSQDAAVLALRQGEIDFLLNPLGMQRGLQDQVVDEEGLDATVNPTFGMRYMAFNMRRPPMDDVAFRRALTTMIDRDFMAENVLQGVADPMYTMMPEGNARWYDESVANEIREQFQFESDQERLEAAVEILREAGYEWQREPEWDEEGHVIPGQGLRMPNGDPVPNLEVLAPAAGYDPLRATYAIWIERWGRELGIPITANPTGFNQIVAQVYTRPPAEPEFDMFILGWSLGNPAMPTFYQSFWHSRHDTAETGGNNTPGFDNEEFDRLADALLETRDEEEAYEMIWDMERILADELPYVVLFDTPILEFYRSEALDYPFTQTLGGIQFLQGMPSTVTAAR
jgi:peptide/nickel transport system substrate-binding protein